jgi:hypothetical protein
MKTLFAAACAAILGAGTASAATLLSEFQPNPTGGDPRTTTVELSGEAGTDFEGVLISVENDGGSLLGRVDRVAGISGTFGANGLLTADIADLENPSFTLVLLSTFTGSTSTDIDTDNDGTIDDISTFGTVLDAISVIDGPSDNFGYGSQLGGLDFAYSGDEPQLMFRDASVGDWFAINDPAGASAFDQNGDPVDFGLFSADPRVPTFGAVNPSILAPVPLPAGLPMLVAGLGLLALRRRA